MTEYPPEFCPYCGSELDASGAPRYRCPGCERSVYHSPSIAASVAVVDETTGELLLGERGTPPSQGRLTMPAGHVDLWEEPATAAARELEEETGLAVDPEALILLGVRDLDAEVDETGITEEKQVICADYAVSFARTSGEPAAADDLDTVQWVAPAEFETLPWAYTGDPAVCRAAIDQV
ncbi:NUDIX domain-containing protein [Halolamina salina]|uniref:NUDIX domain-containing protein n=1 Tax=Halolamina salina TaxID=1220023 RepID=A0ABD6B1T3_9EURY